NTDRRLGVEQFDVGGERDSAVSIPSVVHCLLLRRLFVESLHDGNDPERDGVGNAMVGDLEESDNGSSLSELVNDG
ncbi:hypothetical protein U1Q18_008159, partial [Sarracenia purpurea var. burkii]